MSILSDEIDNRYPLPEAGADTMVSMSRVQAEMLQRKAYAAGALRQFTQEEVEAATRALYETWRAPSYPEWEQYKHCARYQDYTDATRAALEAARTKAVEE